jgi:hypothetical protein
MSLSVNCPDWQLVDDGEFGDYYYRTLASGEFTFHAIENPWKAFDCYLSLNPDVEIVGDWHRITRLMSYMIAELNLEQWHPKMSVPEIADISPDIFECACSNPEDMAIMLLEVGLDPGIASDDFAQKWVEASTHDECVALCQHLRDQEFACFEAGHLSKNVRQQRPASVSAALNARSL